MATTPDASTGRLIAMGVSRNKVEQAEAAGKAASIASRRAVSDLEYLCAAFFVKALVLIKSILIGQHRNAGFIWR